jgi:hypothetical protein
VGPERAAEWGRDLEPWRRSETVRIVELGPKESAPVLRQYVTRVAITRPFFDVTPKSSLEAFEAEAPRHPVFRILCREP